MLYREPDRLEQFLAAMTGLSRPTARAIATAFPWSEFKTFADIGCAQGGLTAEIARAYPHLTGFGCDLPVVGPVFERYVRQQELDQRLAFQPGDFFKDPLPSVDVLVMGHILHDWSLDEKMMLLRKAYEALPPGGADCPTMRRQRDQERNRASRSFLADGPMSVAGPSRLEIDNRPDTIGRDGSRRPISEPFRGLRRGRGLARNSLRRAAARAWSAPSTIFLHCPIFGRGKPAAPAMTKNPGRRSVKIDHEDAVIAELEETYLRRLGGAELSGDRSSPASASGRCSAQKSSSSPIPS